MDMNNKRCNFRLLRKYFFQLNSCNLDSKRWLAVFELWLIKIFAVHHTRMQIMWWSNISSVRVELHQVSLSWTPDRCSNLFQNLQLGTGPADQVTFCPKNISSGQACQIMFFCRWSKHCFHDIVERLSLYIGNYCPSSTPLYEVYVFIIIWSKQELHHFVSSPFKIFPLAVLLNTHFLGSLIFCHTTLSLRGS